MIDYLNNITTGMFGLAFAGIAYLIRTVFTNQKQISMLQKEITERDYRREDDRRIMQEVKSDIKDIKRDIIVLYRQEKDETN